MDYDVCDDYRDGPFLLEEELWIIMDSYSGQKQCFKLKHFYKPTHISLHKGNTLEQGTLIHF